VYVMSVVTRHALLLYLGVIIYIPTGIYISFIPLFVSTFKNTPTQYKHFD